MRPAFFFSYCHFARLKIKQHKLKKNTSIIISNFIFLFFYFKSHTQQGQIIHPSILHHLSNSGSNYQIKYNELRNIFLSSLCTEIWRNQISWLRH